MNFLTAKYSKNPTQNKLAALKQYFVLSDGLEINSAEIAFSLFSLRQGTKIDHTWNVRDIFVTKY